MKMIKLYTSLIIALIMLAGCSSDDDGPSGPQVSSDLFGEWTMQFIDDGNGVEEPLCSEKLYYKFNSDNTYERKDFSLDPQDNCVEAGSDNGTWETISEQSIELTPLSSDSNIETIEFEFVGNNLKILRNSTTEEIYQRP